MRFVRRREIPMKFETELMRYREKANEFFERNHDSRAQKRFSFHPVSRELREELAKTFDYKCAYCETKLVGNHYIDHFRPRSGATNINGEYLDGGYWWLAYEWENMYICCPECNITKRNIFPIEGKIAHVGAKGEELLDEKPLLLDPCYDHPEEHLIFDEGGNVFSSTDKGKATINFLNLNRISLLEERAIEATSLKKLWDILLLSITKDNINNQYIPDDKTKKLVELFIEKVEGNSVSYTTMKNQLFNLWINEDNKMALLFHNSLKNVDNIVNSELKIRKEDIDNKRREFLEYEKDLGNYNIKDKKDLTKYYSKRHLIERIEIHNFKGIDNLDININMDDITPWLMILGENGMGKSSILQAVALTLMDDATRQKYCNSETLYYLNHNSSEGFVNVYVSGQKEPLEIRFNRKSKSIVTKNNEYLKVLLLAYGSTRLLPREINGQIQNTEFIRVDNLFNPFFPLIDAKAWLYNLNSDDFNRAARDLKSLLMLSDNEKIEKSKDSIDILITSSTKRIRLEELSDGYKSVVALTVDIMMIVKELWDDYGDAEGIVLIDEIDAHLHPRWKMQIVSSLRTIFPNLQFIVTSHDPLCLRGIKNGEVIVMHCDINNKVHKMNQLPDHEGLGIDQILTSNYFGLNSTSHPEIDILFEEYYKLLSQNKLSKTKNVRLKKLKKQLEKYELFGDTPREQIIYEAADKYVSEIKNREDTYSDELHEETKNEIINFWESMN